MKNRAVLLVLSIICLLMFFDMGVAAEVTLTVKTSRANIRLNADLEATVITQAPMGAVLKSDAKEGEWYRVQLPPNKDGFVISGYIHESVVLVSEEQPQMESVGKSVPVETPQPQVKKAPPQKKPQTAVVREVKPAKPLMQTQPQTTSKKFVIRPYAKIGYLLLQPSAKDLGYSLAGGNDSELNQYLDVNGLNYGAGVQILLPFQLSPSVRLGLDTGFQKLFNMTFDTGSSDLDAIVEDYDKSTEFEYYLHGMVELSPASSPLFIQGGIGFHLVFWTWDTVYYGYYTGDQSEYEAGVGFGVGLFGLAGFNALQTEAFSLPIGVRIDYLLRYGSLLKASFVIGFAF